MSLEVTGDVAVQSPQFADADPSGEREGESPLDHIGRLSLEHQQGVLPDHLLARAIRAGYIDAGRFSMVPENIQPASLDLRLGESAVRIRASFLPGRDSVQDKLKGYALHEIDIRKEGAMLEAGQPYLVELKERLHLPKGLRGRTNPKSSTGRVDVFTRVITDGSDRFDEITAGYEGGLYLEVVPLSFAVRVREDLTLNQLRLTMGRAALSDQEIVSAHAREPLLYRTGEAIPADQLLVSDGLFLSLDLRGDEWRRVGYSARDHAPLLDLTQQRDLDPEPFWESVTREDGNRIVLSPRKFYLLMSNEAVSISPDLAAEMTAYDPTSGELRTHYAGFFDPGFGFDPDGRFHGSRAALEVRAHEVPFVIEHGQAVCKLRFERMIARPAVLYGPEIGSSYQRQEETLSRHFRRPGDPPRERRTTRR
jgi:dCTP deaminase